MIGKTKIGRTTMIISGTVKKSHIISYLEIRSTAVNKAA